MQSPMAMRKKTKILLTLLPISALVLILTLSSLTTNVAKTYQNREKTPHIHIHIQKKLQIAHSTCEGTLYPQLCVSTLSTFPDLYTKSVPEIIAAAVNHTVTEVKASETDCSGIRKKRSLLALLDKRALDDCLELLDETVSQLKTAITDLHTNKSAKKDYSDLQTLLSGAMTNLYTCLDGFAHSKSNIRPYIGGRLDNISHHVSNSLAMLKKIPGAKKTSREAEVFPEYGKMKGGYPGWLSKKDRRLLQSSVGEIKYDLVVAKDGSGNFTTINEAVEAAPNSSATRFVIYIKGGAYYEYVEVISRKTMLMFVGDGIGKTLIKGNRSVVDGWTTFRSSTVAVVGNGFIARGITFENYAGPSKHQAVALRSGSDLSAFYNCSFVAYQDTLYVHSLRQFYRDCDVYGTIDFIFGNAAVVLQKCNLYARKPNENQKNVFTAQGRDDPFENTGISIQECKVAAAADLIPVLSEFPTYLGRPWKEYSRTIYMLSNMEDVVDPAGWLEWSGDFALSTLYYREYKNRGPGSNTSGRVTWPGFAVTNNATEASMFTVGNFIEGGQRSGKLPPSQRLTWRGDSGLSDGSAMNVDLVGGYYDAGDNMKFGFPMAFTTTMLSWSVIEFGELMKDELQNAREAIRWATDYLLKATSQTDTIFVQVGEANRDHACWERPEDMDTPRSVFKIDRNNPGSDVAAETAAALAAGSLAFKRTDPTYASLLLNRARDVFEFADKYRGSYSNGLKDEVCAYYCSFSGYQDELLWGAAWLHRVTKNPTYLNYIQVNGQTLGADENDNTFSWDDKRVGARILLSKEYLLQKVQSLYDYKGHADNYICSLIPGGPSSQTQFTPGGLIYKVSDSNMQYVTSATFLLLAYAKYLNSAHMVINCGGEVVTPDTLQSIAKKQVDYVLGDNPLKMSYMVGYGPQYPLRIHHRGSSLPSIAAHPAKIECSYGFSIMNSQSPNPNVLVGAVVGGPDQDDQFPDQRSDYAHSEPATYTNAPLVGALAYLAHTYGQL